MTENQQRFSCFCVVRSLQIFDKLVLKIIFVQHWKRGPPSFYSSISAVAMYMVAVKGEETTKSILGGKINPA